MYLVKLLDGSAMITHQINTVVTRNCADFFFARNPGNGPLTILNSCFNNINKVSICKINAVLCSIVQSKKTQLKSVRDMYCF
jgi:hypothetical protein